MMNTMNSKAILGLLVTVLILGVLAAACAPTPEVGEEKEVVETETETAAPAPEVEAETVLIGGFGPLSAPGSYKGGIEMLQAIGMAVDEINEAGGVLGKQVELIFGDTEGLPERGTAVTERLITKDNVVALVGEYHSGVALASMEVAHKYGIPVVFAETWGDEITASGYPEVFRIAPTSEYYSRIATEYIKAVDWKNIVFVVEDTDYGHGQAEAWVDQLADMGISDVEVIFADPATEDFSPILLRIQQSPPDLLGGIITGIGNSRMMRQAFELGLAPTVKTAYFASADAAYPEFWETVGDGGQYVFFSYVGLPKALWNEKTEAFVTNYRERYGQEPGGPAMEAYDATYLVVAAIKETGSTDPEAIIEALENIKVTGVLGEIWFEYTSQNPVPDNVPDWMWHQWPRPNVLILQYVEVGQSVDEANIVFPVELATGPLYTSP